MKTFFLILLLILTVIPITKIFAWEYPNNANNYPYKDSEEDVIDQWNTYTRNCTSYVMWKINSAGKTFNNNPTGPNGNSVTMGSAGHVAWVEKINTNGTVFISEWNWNYGDGFYNERDGYSGDHYSHIINSGSSSCSTIQNRTVSSGQNLNCISGTILVLPETLFSNGSNVNLKST